LKHVEDFNKYIICKKKEFCASSWKLTKVPVTVFNTFCVGVLRVTQEGEADYISAHVPPYSDAINFMGLHQVLPGRARNLHRSHQLICTHHNVFLLHDGCHGTTVPEVPLVEEVHHHSADGMIPAS